MTKLYAQKCSSVSFEWPLVWFIYREWLAGTQELAVDTFWQMWHRCHSAIMRVLDPGSYQYLFIKSVSPAFLLYWFLSVRDCVSTVVYRQPSPSASCQSCALSSRLNWRCCFLSIFAHVSGLPNYFILLFYKLPLIPNLLKLIIKINLGITGYYYI